MCAVFILVLALSSLVPVLCSTYSVPSLPARPGAARGARAPPCLRPPAASLHARCAPVRLLARARARSAHAPARAGLIKLLTLRLVPCPVPPSSLHHHHIWGGSCCCCSGAGCPTDPRPEARARGKRASERLCLCLCQRAPCHSCSNSERGNSCRDQLFHMCNSTCLGHYQCLPWNSVEQCWNVPTQALRKIPERGTGDVCKPCLYL
jgi:hypothetical protein